MSKTACQISSLNQRPPSNESNLFAAAIVDQQQTFPFSSGRKRPSDRKSRNELLLFENTAPTTAGSPAGAAHIEFVMLTAGFSLQCPPDFVMRAAMRTGRRVNPEKLLRRVETFFLHKAAMVPTGLEALPNSWLASLPEILWATCKPQWTRLPYFICDLSVENATLLLAFAQEQPKTGGRVTAWDQIRIQVNASLYPSRWKALKHWHKAKICQARHYGIGCHGQ